MKMRRSTLRKISSRRARFCRLPQTVDRKLWTIGIGRVDRYSSRAIVVQVGPHKQRFIHKRKFESKAKTKEQNFYAFVFKVPMGRTLLAGLSHPSTINLDYAWQHETPLSLVCRFAHGDRLCWVKRTAAQAVGANNRIRKVSSVVCFMVSVDSSPLPIFIPYRTLLSFLLIEVHIFFIRSLIQIEISVHYVILRQRLTSLVQNSTACWFFPMYRILRCFIGRINPSLCKLFFLFYTYSRSAEYDRFYEQLIQVGISDDKTAIFGVSYVLFSVSLILQIFANFFYPLLSSARLSEFKGRGKRSQREMRDSAV